MPYALILWSKATETWADRKMHHDGMLGAHQALIERRVPVGVITDAALERGEWRGAKVIVLPSAECLSEASVTTLRNFVAGGGGLVVTGRTALRDGEGRMRDNFALAELIGADFTGMTKTWLTFLSVPGSHPVARDVPEGFPITVNETLQTLVRPHAGVTALGAIHDPVPGFKMGAAPGPATADPAFVIHELGKGRVVYAAASLDVLYGRFGLADVRQLLVNAVEWAAGRPSPVSATAPETVEVVPWRDDPAKRTILHVINRTGAGLPQSPGQMMHEVIPVHELQINVSPALAGTQAIVQPDGRKLSIRREADGGMSIRLPKLDTWEIIEIT